MQRLAEELPGSSEIISGTGKGIMKVKTMGTWNNWNQGQSGGFLFFRWGECSFIYWTATNSTLPFPSSFPLSCLNFVCSYWCKVNRRLAMECVGVQILSLHGGYLWDCRQGVSHLYSKDASGWIMVDIKNVRVRAQFLIILSIHSLPGRSCHSDILWTNI